MCVHPLLDLTEHRSVCVCVFVPLLSACSAGRVGSANGPMANVGCVVCVRVCVTDLALEFTLVFESKVLWGVSHDGE